jgi:hypothetical protein
MRAWPVLLPVIFLAACSANDSLALQQQASSGYQYQDANHPAGAAQASGHMGNNSNHGTWLWPPAQNDMPE